MESRISTEKKLQLARKIREEHETNRNVLRGREAILYGKGSPEPYYEIHSLEERTDAGVAEGFSTLKIRAVISAFLFLAFLVLETKGGNLFGVTAADVTKGVEMDYTANLFDFMENIPYTLNGSS